ncbi:MAG: hypothetical protein K2K44_08715 [Oscillospiraceae bacterium]|nr:hypothetical protein [Oscillospiraceae bacterium]
MRKVQEKLNHLSLIISTAAAVMAFFALIISIAALIKSFKRSRMTTTEYDGCHFEYDDDFEDEDLAF